MKKKPYELRLKEANNFIEKNKDGDVVYHAIGTLSDGITASEKAEDILENGFKFNQNKGALTPDSISFFVEKHPAYDFGSRVVLFKLPKRVILLNIEIETEESENYFKWCEDNGYKKHDAFEPLIKNGYHGVICEANGGTEYRIYDKSILDEGIIFNNGHKMTIYNALKEGKEVPEEVLKDYSFEDFEVNINFENKENMDEVRNFLLKKVKSKSSLKLK